MNTQTIEISPVDSHRSLQLIEATISTIADSGLSHLTMAKVAARAGLSTGIVNFYFKSKKQLLLTALKHLADEYINVVTEHLATAHNTEQRLLAYVNASFDQRVFAKDKIAVWHAFWSESQAREEYLKICGENDQQEFHIVQKAIAELIDNSNNDSEIYTMGLIGIIDNLWQQTLQNTQPVDQTYAIDICKRYIGSIPRATRSMHEQNKTTKRSELLPIWTYCNEEFFHLEIEELFKPSWMLVGHVSDIPNPGNYLTFDGFGERAFVIRNKQGEIKAFHNICRHRGSKILNGQGQCPRALVCPFHGWRYDLNGKLKFIPGEQGFPKIDKKNYGLKPLDLEIWNGFVFIRFISGGPSVNKILQPIEDEIREYRLSELKPYPCEKYQPHHSSTRRSVNWKVFHDIDNEGYHVPIGHPSLQQLYGDSYIDTYIDDISVSYGRFNKRFGNLWSVRHYRKLMMSFEHLSTERGNLWFYFSLFPNLVFALYPEMMEIYMSIPVDISTTDILSRSYALPDNRSGIKALRYLNHRINMITDAEDSAYMTTIQEGLKSSAFPTWTLSESAETGVRAYHNAIQERLPIATLAKEPVSGTIATLNGSMTTEFGRFAYH